MASIIGLAESGWVPDSIIRVGIRQLVKQRLREERRKIDETIKEFENYQAEKRRSKDSEEFDDFMKTRKRKPAPRSSKAASKKSSE